MNVEVWKEGFLHVGWCEELREAGVADVIIYDGLGNTHYMGIRRDLILGADQVGNIHKEQRKRKAALAVPLKPVKSKGKTKGKEKTRKGKQKNQRRRNQCTT